MGRYDRGLEIDAAKDYKAVFPVLRDNVRLRAFEVFICGNQPAAGTVVADFGYSTTGEGIDEFVAEGVALFAGDQEVTLRVPVEEHVSGMKPMILIRRTNHTADFMMHTFVSFRR